MSLNVYDNVAQAWDFVENQMMSQETAGEKVARQRLKEAGFRPGFAAQAEFIAHAALAVRAQSVILLGGAQILEAMHLTHTLGSEGQVTIIDTSAKVTTLATQIFKSVEEESTVRVRIVNASGENYLPRLNSMDYDMIVAAGDTSNYRAAYDSAERLLRRGGELVFSDALGFLNADSKGGLTNPADRSEKATFLRQTLKQLRDDDRFSSTLVSVGTGLSLNVLQ
ncbi:MAG: hypothetical protein PUF51_00965 [Bifidobacteriaceae bacterium]|nr:hypothetical protein [Bifidobacteriaceae bacterium]